MQMRKEYCEECKDEYYFSWRGSELIDESRRWLIPNDNDPHPLIV